MDLYFKLRLSSYQN